MDRHAIRQEYRATAGSDLLTVQASRDNWRLLCKRLVRVYYEYSSCVGQKCVTGEYEALRDAMAEARTLIITDEGKAP